MLLVAQSELMAGGVQLGSGRRYATKVDRGRNDVTVVMGIHGMRIADVHCGR